MVGRRGDDDTVLKDKVDVWNFVKELWEYMKLCFPLPPQTDQKAWDDLSDKASELSKKWDDKGEFGKFCRKVIVDWLEYIGHVEVKK